MGGYPGAASSHSAEFPSLCSEVGPDRSLILSACAAACQSNRRDWLSCCLCGFAAREWAADLDFSALRKLPAEYLSEERLVRRGDTVWQVCLHDRRLVLVMVEFQSGEEPRMVLRILAYTSLLYQEARAQQCAGAPTTMAGCRRFVLTTAGPRRVLCEASGPRVAPNGAARRANGK